MNARACLLAGTISAFLAVALGAFGAHALKTRLSEYSLGVYQTGVTYQMTHALALIGFALWLQQTPTASTRAGIAFLAGTVVFSGSLYALALTDVKILGAITPLGGVCFLVGWAMWAFQVAGT